MSFLDFISAMRTSKIREMIPKPLRSLGYQILPKLSLEQKMWRAEYKQVLNRVKPAPLRIPTTLGIIKDFLGKYGNYEAACLELGVPYRLIDISGHRWIEEVLNSKCEAFLVWPPAVNAVSKQMFDERLKIMVKAMNKIIFPSYEALWLHESKRRMNDWLTAHNIPHPRTQVFFDKEQALEFVDNTQFPLVFKTDLGAVASGVEIVSDKKNAKKLINRCFGKGYIRKRCIWGDRSRGCVLFQEYLPNAQEWRIIRIGDSFFGHQKLKKGKFHSGSKLVGWYEPPRKLLNLARQVTDKGRFLSMNIDVFETNEGRFLVNELQAVFGSINKSQMYIDGKPGRFVYDNGSDSWRFDEGYFCQNASCNLRVRTLLELIGVDIPGEIYA